MSAEQRDDNAAALGFVAVLGLLFGGVGVVIAALSVGIERAWTGRAGGSSDGWGQAVADHEAWLSHDRKRRDAWRKARRDWWESGADPETEPKREPGTTRFWRGLRRWWARLFISADRVHKSGRRFGDGWRAGWAAARRARRDGAGWWETARTRPDPEPQPADPDGTGTDEAPDPAAEESPDPWSYAEPLDEPVTGQTVGEQVASLFQPEPQPEPETTSTEPEPAGGTEMTAPVVAVGGETNLDQTEADLENIRAHLVKVQEAADVLAGARAGLEGAVAVAAERAAQNGATSATQQALDEANAVVAEIGRTVSTVSDMTVQATDHVNAAQTGLAPARDAQDQLHANGARGEFVSAATSS